MGGSRNAFLVGSLLTFSACSDGVAPPAALSFDAGELAVTGEALLAAPGADAQQSTTGGRASGHAEISRVVGTTPIAEKYSFIALSTEPSASQPFAAKGEIDAITTATLPTRVSNRSLHADITCLRIVGNTAVASGPLERFVVDGQPVSFQPGLQLVFRVEDNGEGGGGTVDQASRIVLTLSARAACEFFPLQTDPSERANIQVQQR